MDLVHRVGQARYPGIDRHQTFQVGAAEALPAGDGLEGLFGHGEELADRLTLVEKLAERVRRALAGRKAVGEIKMFGGVCFTLRGNMLVGVVKDELMVRLAKEGDAAVSREPHVRPMDFTGRPMKGFFFVRPSGLRTAAALRKWIDRCAAYSSTLPPKA